MCDYSLPLHLLQPLFLNQSRYGMEGSAYFERANALQILALEEELNPRVRGLLALPLCSLQGFGCLTSIGEVGQGGVGQDGRVVDVRFDKGVGGFDRGARQGSRRCWRGHCRRWGGGSQRKERMLGSIVQDVTQRRKKERYGGESWRVEDGVGKVPASHVAAAQRSTLEFSSDALHYEL